MSYEGKTKGKGLTVSSTPIGNDTLVEGVQAQTPTMQGQGSYVELKYTHPNRLSNKITQ